jgi:hypothetical protein
MPEASPGSVGARFRRRGQPSAATNANPVPSESGRSAGRKAVQYELSGSSLVIQSSPSVPTRMPPTRTRRKPRRATSRCERVAPTMKPIACGRNARPLCRASKPLICWKYSEPR